MRNVGHRHRNGQGHLQGSTVRVEAKRRQQTLAKGLDLAVALCNIFCIPFTEGGVDCLAMMSYKGEGIAKET